MNEQNNKDLELVFKILAGIFGVWGIIRGIALFFSGIASFFGGFSHMRRHFFGGVFYSVNGLVQSASGVLFIAMALLTYFMIRKDIAKNAKKLYITFAGLGAVILVVSVVRILLQLMFLAAVGARARVRGVNFLGNFMYAIVAVGVMYALYFVLKINPFAGITGENIKDEVITSVKDVFEMTKQEFAGRKKMDNENMNVNNGPVETVNPENAEVIAPPPVVTYEDVSHTQNENANAGQQTYTQQGTYVPPTPQPIPAPNAYAFKPLKTDRSLVIYILLTLVTCGIYSYIWIYELISDMNTVCAGDGDETPSLLKYILLTMVTCGIYSWIWWYKLGNRMQLNAPRYGLQFAENGTTILLWMLIGALLCGVGPFVAMYYVIKNMNELCMAYNRYNGAC